MIDWILEHVPSWLRTRWPLRRYYWQQAEIDAATEKAKNTKALLTDYITHATVESPDSRDYHEAGVADYEEFMRGRSTIGCVRCQELEQQLAELSELLEEHRQQYANKYLELIAERNQEVPR